MKRVLVLLAVMAASLSAQGPVGVYTYEKSTTLSGAAENVTIHLPSAATRGVQFVAATIYCSAVCTATLKRDGTAPTTTAGTATKLNNANSGGTIAAAAAVPYHTSNVGAGTTVKTYSILATEERILDLSEKGLRPGENLTLSIASMTGDVRIYFQWREY